MHLHEWLEGLSLRWGVGAELGDWVASLCMLVGVMLICVAANFVAKTFIVRGVETIIRRTETSWDDMLIEQRVFDRLSHVAPGLVLYMSAGLVFPLSVGSEPMPGSFAALQEALRRAAQVYIIIMGAGVAEAFLSAVVKIYGTYEVSRVRPIKSYVQVAKILVYLLTAILAISLLIGQSPVVLLSGLGALSAILLLVFKDSIMGLVASVQLSAHDMVRRGDWIEVPKYGIDGDVLDVTLNTVKIQNFDKTTTTLPTHALITDSFKNWRGMSDSGGRRIKRALFIDMNSVDFCGEDLLDRLQRIELIRDYVTEKRAELRTENEARGVDESELVNGRRLTNLGIFRAYTLAYLRFHPKIHEDMTLLVRQLPPSERGIGIELYCFSNEQGWAVYESIQADLFDHLIASTPRFGLRMFQAPSGMDLQRVVQGPEITA